MIKQYKLRDINRNDTLHKEIFVLKSDCMQILNEFVIAAVKAGASEEKLKEIISNEKTA